MTPSLRALCANLSGGNQQKVVIAKWLATHPRVLLVDELTRGVDVGAKAEIYRVLKELRDEGLAIVMVSSELVEVLSVSDRILVMKSGSAVGVLEGLGTTPLWNVAPGMERKTRSLHINASVQMSPEQVTLPPQYRHMPAWGLLVVARSCAQ